MKLIIFLLTFLVTCECQVILNKSLLATWIPTYTTATFINLSHSNISLIESRTFSGLTQLQDLRLYNNKLTTIDSFTFNDLVNLRTLSLFANQLSYIDPYTFVNLKSLS